jgi:hypothetical protein
MSTTPETRGADATPLADSSDATPLAERPTTSDRILRVAGWLVEGKVRPECVAMAMKEWQVSRRTAQVYVARAARRIGRMATDEDPLFAMKLGQIQRDLLYQELQNLLRGGEFIPFPHWQMKVKTIQATLKVLDSRDRTAARIAALTPSPLSTGAKGEGAGNPSPLSEGKGRENPGPGPQMLRDAGGQSEEPLTPHPSPLSTGARGVIAAKVHPDRPKSAAMAQRAPASQQPAAAPRRECQPDLVSSLRSFAARPAAQATEQIAIVPSGRKAKAGKDMRPTATNAPGGANCALESCAGVNATG